MLVMITTTSLHVDFCTIKSLYLVDRRYRNLFRNPLTVVLSVLVRLSVLAAHAAFHIGHCTPSWMSVIALTVLVFLRPVVLEVSCFIYEQFARSPVTTISRPHKVYMYWKRERAWDLPPELESRTRLSSRYKILYPLPSVKRQG